MGPDSIISRLKNFGRTLFTIATTIVLTMVIGPLIYLLVLKDEYAPDGVIHFWCRGILKEAGVKVDVHGFDRIPAGHCVFVSNHQSLFDSPLIMGYLPRHLRFVAKRQVFKIPIFGRAMRVTGNVEVDRTGTEQDRERLRAAITAVRDRVSLLFFAEGTRSVDGTLGRFKKGAAVLALEAKVPIVPLAVTGTLHILPKGTRLIRGGPAALWVGEPIPTEGLTIEDRDALTDKTRLAVAALLEKAAAKT